jgi:hypothetical protein
MGHTRCRPRHPWRKRHSPASNLWEQDVWNKGLNEINSPKPRSKANYDETVIIGRGNKIFFSDTHHGYQCQMICFPSTENSHADGNKSLNQKKNTFLKST